LGTQGMAVRWTGANNWLVVLKAGKKRGSKVSVWDESLTMADRLPLEGGGSRGFDDPIMNGPRSQWGDRMGYDEMFMVGEVRRR
jgi:hypothetical protein